MIISIIYIYIYIYMSINNMYLSIYLSISIYLSLSLYICIYIYIYIYGAQGARLQARRGAIARFVVGHRAGHRSRAKRTCRTLDNVLRSSDRLLPMTTVVVCTEIPQVYAFDSIRISLSRGEIPTKKAGREILYTTTS